MPPQQRAMQTRRDLLVAAAEVFCEKGYEAASTVEIFQRAGVTKGALYFHFKSKSDLALGVLEEAVTTEGVAPQTFKLQEWIDIAMALAYRLPREPMLRAALLLQLDPQFRSIFGTQPWKDWIELTAQYLSDAKRAGELLAHVDPERVARVLVSSWAGTEAVLEGVPSERDFEEEVSYLIGMVFPSIAVPAVLMELDASPGRGIRIFKESGSPGTPKQIIKTRQSPPK
ncbi:ScbR family autoregulator-binding transcription factor [Streptomyces sp. NPDC102467]|uniref:ScbR family autoregulator-binding transcription factor n=1 Tax=Streptomyces sp. NPDC102467 TaxID=3366179 RepID=UPI0038149E95